MNNPVVRLIDAKIRETQMVGENTDDWCVPPHRFAGNSRRRYLGASQIGGACNRAAWYSFHWAGHSAPQDPRMLRLFDRGHREEQRMIGYLRMIGVEVQEHDPSTVPSLWHHPESDSYVVILGDNITEDLATHCLDVSGTFHEWIARGRGIEIPEPRQFSYTALDGHHAGNCDGRARNIPEYELWGLDRDEWALLEFKTHNDRSFVGLINQAVKGSKSDHYKQVQRYMHKIGYRLCVYVAVNKNDDSLYCEYIPIDPNIDAELDWKAHEAIYSPSMPARISNSPSWYECKWCDFRPYCHFGHPLAKNCRTCQFSQPGQEGNWYCHNWKKYIPQSAELQGCDYHKQRTD